MPKGGLLGGVGGFKRGVVFPFARCFFILWCTLVYHKNKETSNRALYYPYSDFFGFVFNSCMN